MLMSNYRAEITPQDIILCYERLHCALVNFDLPTKAGPVRRGVEATEFMFMNYSYAGHVRFKHIFTKNYLVLCPDDTLSIPTGGPFFLGFFDSALRGAS